MAIGERIGFFRKRCGMTQKTLGIRVGFPEKTADIRINQYEMGARNPKADLTTALADALDVSPKALAIPNIDSCDNLMHILFALEDKYGLEVCEIDGEVYLRINSLNSKDAAQLRKMMCSWQQAVYMLKAGEITQEEYDRWRYCYPNFNISERKSS